MERRRFESTVVRSTVQTNLYLTTFQDIAYAAYATYRPTLTQSQRASTRLRENVYANTVGLCRMFGFT